MLQDRVWIHEANMDNSAGAAHMECIQDRIGRRLEPMDFLACPLTEREMGEDQTKWFGPPLGAEPNCEGFIGPLYAIKNGKPYLNRLSAFDSPSGHHVGVRIVHRGGDEEICWGD